MRLSALDHARVQELDGRVEQPEGKIGGNDPGFEDARRLGG